MKISETIKRLLIAYVVVFVLERIIDQFMGGNVREWLALIPIQVVHGKIWQFFTFSFLHSDVMQLVLNCMVLAFLGADIESLWGRKKFLAFYFMCTLVSGLFYFLVQITLWNPLYLSLPMVGASGGIYGLLVAYAILFSERQLLFMMMFPMKASQFIWILAAVEFLQALFSGQGGLSAISHLSGMAAGFFFLWFQAKGFQTFMKNRGPAKRKSNHLRLIKTPADAEDDENPRGPKTWH